MTIEIERPHALQDSERRVRLLEMAETMSGIGHWRYELAGGSVTWSDEVYRIHGLDRKSFTPGLDNVVDAYHPEDRARLGECIDQAIAHQTDYTFELRIIRSDGAIRTVRSTARCEVADDGSTAVLFGLLEDVTERKALEEQILKAGDVARETARRAELAERTAGLGHWRLEPDTVALTWSDQMYEIYGLPRSHPLELGALMAMTHHEDRDGANEKLAREIRTGKTTDD